MRVYNKLGQISGKIEDGKPVAFNWDFKQALKEWDGRQDLVEFFEQMGFRVEKRINNGEKE